jgi:hypothetical protein
MICTHWFLKNISYTCLMSLVQLPHPFRAQNICLFNSNVCKQSKCKQTLYSFKTWLKLSFWYHICSVLAFIALSMNLRLVTFLQPHPSAFYRNRGEDKALLLFQLLIATLSRLTPVNVSP